MAVQWSTTSREAVQHGAKVLVYAGAGDGKTLMCATAPKPVILSAESGLLSLSKKNLERVYGVATPGITYDIPVMQITTFAQLEEAYMFFARDPSARQYFQTICGDSLSEIAEVVLANEKTANKDPRKAYGEMADKVIGLVKAFRNLAAFDIYFTAKMEAMDTGAGVIKFGPSMPGKQLAVQLPYLFDEMFHLGIGQAAAGQSYRYLLTDGNLQYQAKDRSGVLDQIEKPDLTHIFHKLKGA